MSDLIGASVWAQFKSVIDSAHDTFNQQPITWKRSKGGLDLNGEDNLSEQFDMITLYGLVDYNAFRKWPVTQTSETGELDRQTEVLLLNMEYLRNEGYLNANNYFAYNEAADRFIHNGITYKAYGGTHLSQTKTEPLLFMVILQRQEIPT